MKNKKFKRMLVIVILSLFICASLTPVKSALSNNTKSCKLYEQNKNQSTSTITFYTFDKTKSKECSIDLSEDVYDDIINVIEDLDTLFTLNYAM